MPGGNERDTSVCRSFCAYYKPDKKSDEACQGLVVLQLIGRKAPTTRPARTVRPSSRDAEGLKRKVCAACAFHEADCDFILTGGSAEPCGGMVLLMHLLGSGELTLDELDRLIT